MGTAHPPNVHRERAEQQEGDAQSYPSSGNQKALRALLGAGAEAGAAGSFQGAALGFLSASSTILRDSSSGRWRQLWRWDWLWLSRLLALAEAAGKMSTQGLSAPGSVTICQTLICKAPKQRKCWRHGQPAISGACLL